MKANYEKPIIEFEEYTLASAIASGCTYVPSFAPEDFEYNGKFYELCDEFAEELSIGDIVTKIGDTAGSLSTFGSGTFMENSCDCFISSSGSTLFTS